MKFIPFSLIVFSILLLNACAKEEVVVDNAKIDLPETINKSMQAHHISISSSVLIFGEERGCLFYGDGSQYDWDVDYRFAEGYVKDEKVFYPIEKKWDVDFTFAHFEEGKVMWLNDSWHRELDWSKTDDLYRYDPNKKLALLYKGENDQNPKTIMDFNLALGESWVLDTLAGIKLEVVSTNEFTSNGVIYPSIEFEIIQELGQETTGPQLTIDQHKRITLSPLNPNPFRLCDNFNAFLNPQWEIFKTKNSNQPEKWIPNLHPGLYPIVNSQTIIVDWQTDETSSIGSEKLNESIPIYCMD